ncbi:MAG: helix-turn-helix domain-containing protein [Ruminococcus sp.]|nr:helix-turn-helix domain-containing protein [Ruminococcus sp.]
MTNTQMLREKIKMSGYKMRFIAEKVGLTYQGLFNKIENRRSFRANEIYALCQLLDIHGEEKERIFFDCNEIQDCMVGECPCYSDEQKEKTAQAVKKPWQRL